jgi:AGZA family xanthine/uracil permease-like MFS transporter
VPVTLGIGGSIASWPTVVFVAGLVLTWVLVARRVRAAILIGMLASTVLAIVIEAIANVGPSNGTNPKGWNLGYPALPSQVVGLPDLSLVATSRWAPSSACPCSPPACWCSPWCWRTSSTRWEP